VFGPESFTAFEPFNIRAGQPTVPYAVAFDANNRMILGADAYGNPRNERVFYYANPLPACTATEGCVVRATAVLPGVNAQPASVAFDSAGNLAVLDHTWNRVLFYPAAQVSTWMAAQR
jgi:hypothetical protein